MTSAKVRRPRWYVFVIPLVTLLVCGGITEVVARIWEYNLGQSDMGWELIASRRIQVVESPDLAAGVPTIYRPNTEFSWENIPFKVNSQGLRDQEWSFDKPEGTYRILSIGDSVAMGWNALVEDIYAKQLAAKLQERGGATYEAINFALGGRNLPIELNAWKATGHKYNPDLVVVGITAYNDINDRVYVIPPPNFVDWMRQNVVSWVFLSNLLRPDRQLQVQHALNDTDVDIDAAGNVVNYPFPLDETDPAYDRDIREPMLEMAAFAEETGTKLMFVVLPSDPQARYPEYPTTAQDVINKLAEEHDLVVIDMLPEFRARFAELVPEGDVPTDALSPLFADLSSHMNKFGHQLIADAIYERILSEGFLPPS